MATCAGVPVGFSGARDRDADNPLTPGYGLSTKKHETAACRIADTFFGGLGDELDDNDNENEVTPCL